MRLLPVCVVAYLLGGSLAHAGLLITRSDKGLSFVEAYELTVNGKDKVLSLGPRAVLGEKPPQVALNGTVIKDASSNVLAQFSEGSVDYVIPRVNLKNEPASASEIWKSAEISYRTEPKQKATTDVPLSAFVAFLPAGTEELVGFCKNDRAMLLIGGGKDAAFAAQVALITAVAARYKSDPSLAPLKAYVESSMQKRLDRFQTGTANLNVLSEALQFSQLSESAYADDPAQAKLRKTLADLKAWLDRRVAVLRAFSSTSEWDPFLLASRDFAVYQDAYPEIASKHVVALKASLTTHRETGDQRLSAHEYAAAWREYRIALARNPADPDLQRQTLSAWTDYSRQVAIDHKADRKQLSAGQVATLNRALQFAANYQNDGKLDQAYKQIQEAEQIDPDSLDLLLRKAEVLGAQGDFTSALAALDAYDKIAVDDERGKAGQLRNELLFKQTSRVENARKEWQENWTQMNFLHARDAALSGVRAKDDDPDLLFSAGESFLAARDAANSHKYFSRYLDVSDTLQGNDQQRASARRLLAESTPIDKVPAKGDPNWISGAKLPRGLQYDPVSLGFQPRIEHIEASGKMKVAYEWHGGRLVSVTPSWEKPEQNTGEKRITFAYDAATGQLAKVSTSDQTLDAVKWTGDDAVSQSAVLLLNNPYIDPVAVQRLTGKPISVTVAGNPYFNPFVWSQPCYFQLTYDDSGRVAEARQLSGLHGTPTDKLVEFEWAGWKLMAVRGYEVSGSQKSLAYTRSMQYDGDTLMSEEIDAGGKTAHIKYRYEGDRLISANCERDPSLDNRSRQITFAPPTTAQGGLE